MTVIRPNSVSGITSITAQANEINFFRSNGTLAGLQLNGVNFNTTTGISTFAALKVTGNLDVEGVLTYQDVTNVDSVGIITARSMIDAQGDVSIADKIIHTGDTNTAIRFPAADTITAETAGSERLRITDTGKVAFNYDVTASDTQYGQVEIFKNGASNVDNDWSYLSFHRVGQIAWQQGIDSNGFVIASTGGGAKNTLDVEKLRINSAGALITNTTGTLIAKFN